MSIGKPINYFKQATFLKYASLKMLYCTITPVDKALYCILDYYTMDFQARTNLVRKIYNCDKQRINQDNLPQPHIE